ncbi:AAA domain-containing protein [Mycena venus]|uniref:AAA domain-containing protein n=1 Tax=Mycena venus TaxID=2733690 RepID=A0A8H6XIR5_9AGAR|nr:AAA domain-containing protein [Mycena venus]
MLPSQPKIFHGRESEVSEILQLFSLHCPRIAILGTGGIGKTTLARAIVHHQEISNRYKQYRAVVVCDSATDKLELAALIGAHLGLKPGKDLTKAVLAHLSASPPSLLVLDNLETVWEPVEYRGEIEGFLALLTDIDHLALVITMRGTERPAKVRWTRPFVLPLRPLEHAAAQQAFIEIADSCHDPADVDKYIIPVGDRENNFDLSRL